MSIHHLYLIFCLLLASVVSAQQLPTQVELPEQGISFDVPPGWSAYVEGEAILMGHESIPGLIIMTKSQASSIDQLKQLARHSIVDQGIHLNPIGEFEAIGNKRLEGYYQGTFNGEAVKAYALALIDLKGKGVNIISLTTASQFTSQNQNDANKLAASVKFYQAVDSASTVAWKQKIAGQQLKYMHTSGSSDYSGGYSGSSDRVFIELCSDGRFFYQSSTQGSYEGGGGFGHVGSSDNSAGSYQVNSNADQTYLSLNFTNGEAYEYNLTSNQQGNTFLDANRYFVTDLESCY